MDGYKDLIMKLKEVFRFYLESFFNIIMDDGVLDKHELILILNSVSHSLNYVNRMFTDLTNERLEEIEQEINLRPRKILDIKSPSELKNKLAA